MALKDLITKGLNVRKDANRRGEYPYSLSRNIDHFFDKFYSGFPPDLQGADVAFTPKVDVYVMEKEIRVIAELPGLDESDIDISLTNDVLIISGEKKKEEKIEGYCRIERSHGWFTRAIPIFVEIKTDKVEAKFKRGVLTIVLPKTPESSSNRKKVAISAD
jgi:HSP20 family protein